MTIVTPSLNQGRYLELCLDSVASQDYPAVEHIVMDGGSTDGSVDTLRVSRGLAFWSSEPDVGQSAAINKGMRRARGTICAWLCADDLLFPSAVGTAVALLRPDVAAVYGDRLVIDAKGNAITITRHPPYDRRMFRRNITIPQETVFFWKSAFDEVGGLDESLHFSMDFDLWIRMAQRRDLLHVPAVLGAYRQHDASKSTMVHSGDERSAGWQAEHERVYRRHFGRDLPTGLEACWHRSLHRIRTALSRVAAQTRPPNGHSRPDHPTGARG